MSGLPSSDYPDQDRGAHVCKHCEQVFYGSGPVMHKASGAIFDRIIAAADPSSLMPLTSMQPAVPTLEPVAWRWIAVCRMKRDPRVIAHASRTVTSECAAQIIVKQWIKQGWNERLFICDVMPIYTHPVPDVDDLAQFIRQVDGKHEMGAGALAERICDWLSSRTQEPT